MDIIIRIIYYFFSVVALIYGAYFSITGFVGILKRSSIKLKKTEAKAHFAILLPARNEEKVIEHLIESLKNQRYDSNYYDIYVIPNNCTDNTAKVARSNGAKIISCSEITKTKGDVLNIAFKKLKSDTKIDAYIVFDADNVVHPDFLSKMNECYQSGFRVAQGFRDAKNPNDNWISGSYAIFYLMQNVFFNRARMGLGASASVNGTGFMIKKGLIDQYGFETHTLTEDVEFSGICALRNEKIVFVEDAITYDEYPVGFNPSWRQRRRWTSGNLECAHRYHKKLVGNFIRTKKIANIDMLFMYCGAIFQVLTLFLMILTHTLNIFDVTFNNFFPSAIASLLFTSLVGYLFGLLIEVFAVIYKKKSIISLWKGIIFFPLFLITWILINIVCFVKKQTKWDEIKHTRVVKIDDLLDKKIRK